MKRRLPESTLLQSFPTLRRPEQREPPARMAVLSQGLSIWQRLPRRRWIPPLASAARPTTTGLELKTPRYMSTTSDESVTVDVLMRFLGVAPFLVRRPTTAPLFSRMSSTTMLSESMTIEFPFPGAAEVEATAAAETEGSADSGSLLNPLPMDLTLHWWRPTYPVRNCCVCCT